MLHHFLQKNYLPKEAFQFYNESYSFHFQELKSKFPAEPYHVQIYTEHQFFLDIQHNNTFHLKDK